MRSQRRLHVIPPVSPPLFTTASAVSAESVSATASAGEATLDLFGLHCAACGGIVESALWGLPGMERARVSVASHRAVVRWDPHRLGLPEILLAVERAGYKAVPSTGAQAEVARRDERRTLLWRLFVAWFCAMQVMMLATPSYVAAPGDITPDLLRLLNWGQWLLSLPVMLFAAGPFLHQAARSVRLRRIGMDVPVALGVLVMFGASTVATFMPAGPLGNEVVFDSLTMFLAFLLTGRWLEMRVRHQAALELEKLIRRAPESVQRVTGSGAVETIEPSQLCVGDRIRISSGQTVAADGVIVQGRTQLAQSLLTGESMPVLREVGHTVLAGSLNVGAPVDLRVTAVGEDIRLQQIVRMAERAAVDRPALVQMADRWAGPFLWGVLALSALGWIAWQFIDPARALWVSVAVLVVTCPCALSLAAPATLSAAAQAMARRGILLQRLGAVEELARADLLIFDKTGTLTEDRLVLYGWSRLRPEDPVGPDPLQHAASLAAWSAHPASRALVEAARGSGTATPQWPHTAWSEVIEEPGQGLQARDPQGRLWRLGRAQWVGADLSEPDGPEGIHLFWGQPHRRGQAVVIFELVDRVRDEAVASIAALRKAGLELGVLSGDGWARVTAVATPLGLGVLAAAALPQDKRDRVKAMQAQGHRVVMVGDGINDAPVLSQADVSIAMGQGAAASLARADFVVLASRLDALPQMVHRARTTMRLVRQNLAWALAYNLAAIPLALAGWLPPWAAGLGMALSSTAVVLNSRRAACD